KTAKLLGLGYPGGPALAALAERGRPDVHRLPRPMLGSGDLDFSFSGLKTAVLVLARELAGGGALDAQQQADLARAFQDAIVEVLVRKSLRAVKECGLQQLVVAGGVGANRSLRARLDQAAKRRGWQVYYPEPELCTDNGAMIAFAGAMRLVAGEHGQTAGRIGIRPRWPLAEVGKPV
ncbi:MAG TPA: tRNA (adenosine(37)-N6)-threonylcarbamoyltransferase complex transferase subunit TsaD, partial [Pseudothauera hydrothermalis]|nr:tRNA (adenosine(37)-N6)-threonylcarbamoyltransferase complex transferase subunit TsaD [Pseudothauera hydrothermalis]